VPTPTSDHIAPTQAEDIDLASPRAEAIIDTVARQKPWRWWPDYWFSYVFRRWPVFIYTTCFALAHYQYWMLALSVAALYADWKYLPRYAQDLRLNARELVTHIIKDEPIPWPIPEHWWAEIKRVYIVGGIVVLSTIVLLASFSGTIIEAGLERPASLLLALEWYALGIVSLVLIGYFSPQIPRFQGYLEGKPDPIRTRLKLAARRGPSEFRGAGAKFLRVFSPVCTVAIGAACIAYFDAYSRDGLEFPGESDTQIAFETILVFIVFMNIILPSIVMYQTAARRFLALHAKSDPQDGARIKQRPAPPQIPPWVDG
jgi:hypothetical protein